MPHFRQSANDHHDYIVGLRRHFHQHPELSLKEQDTAELIKEELAKLGVPFITVGDYGIVATIEGQRTDQMVALRADMDALPICEENAHLDYCSQNHGVMHACGHDGHVAMLLGAAKLLHADRASLNGTVKLCFQQAEEVGKGAQEILDELDKHPIKSVFAIHLWSEIESGKISVEAGPRMAQSEALEITITGMGCHGATPNLGVDPILTAAALVMNLSAMMSREIRAVDPSILTFGKIQSGTMGNIIPGTATLFGTLRTVNQGVRAHLKEAILRFADFTAQAYRATAKVQWVGGVPVVRNDPRCSDIAAASVRELAGERAVTRFDTMMASENYGCFLEKYPGVMAFVGVKNEACGAIYPHHHPQFNIDEAPLSLGAALHAQYAYNYLQQFNDGATP